MSLLDKVKGNRDKIKASTAGRVRAYKFKPGKTVISILPGHPDADTGKSADDFEREYGAFYLKNKKDELVAVVGDRAICYGEDDQVGEALSDLYRYGKEIGDDTITKMANDARSKKNFLFNIMVHVDTEKKALAEPQLAQFSENMFDDLLSVLEEYIEEGETADTSKVLRWKDRLLFVVEREGTGKTDTRYKVYPFSKTASVDPSVMTKAVPLDKWIEAQFDPVNVSKALSYVGLVSGGRVGTSPAAMLGGGAPAGAPALMAPASMTPASTPSTEEEDLLAALAADEAPAAPTAMEKTRAVDATFEPVTTTTPAAPSSNDTDDLLAEIDALAA